MLRILSEKYPSGTNADIAAEIGVGTRLIASKAAELGLVKDRLNQRQESVRIVLENFGKCSYSDISRLADISKRTISRIAVHYGLKREACDSSRFISDKRKNLIRRERLRLRIGLEPVSNIKVTGNRKRTTFRSKLKRYGYVVIRGTNKVFFTSDSIRSAAREMRGNSLGLTFHPLPATHQ